ncbi:AbrB family transcriptional regulator [Xanthobacter sp. KR7-225]|uniref:AbrB family transcriptional regulator n=1 Tax=Xanthobacter sp. KR7-225 TaxID=3156613 RepID=UPI0032B47F0F
MPATAVTLTIRTVLLLAACLAGGLAFSWLHVPLPFLLGALFVSAAFGLSGFAVNLHDAFRQAGQVAAGFSVGLFFTPPVALRLLELGWLMAATGFASILVALFLARLLALFGRCDRRTAFFAALPGGLAEMAVLAHTFGASTTLVSLAQSLRVVLIVLIIPPAMALVMGGEPRHLAQVPQLEPHLLALGLALCVPAALLLQRAKIFNPFLLAGLALGMGTALIIARATHAPPLVTGAAQLAIGAALGCRFQREQIRHVLSSPFLPAAAATTLALMAANVGLAALAVHFVVFPTGVLAMAPGGIAEMSLTAEALGLAPPIVAAWQLVRILAVVLLTGPLYRLYERISAR